jgi:uncharacterized UPF0160 family protein
VLPPDSSGERQCSHPSWSTFFEAMVLSRTAVSDRNDDMCQDMAETCAKSRKLIAETRELIVELDRMLAWR